MNKYSENKKNYNNNRGLDLGRWGVVRNSWRRLFLKRLFILRKWIRR